MSSGNPTYARYGIFAVGYFEHEISLDEAYAPAAFDVDNQSLCDLGKHSFGGDAVQEQSVDTAWQLQSISTVSNHAAKSLALREHRSSAYRFQDGYVPSPFVTTTRGGVGSPTKYREGVQVDLLEVTLPSGSPFISIVPSTSLEVVHGIENIGSVLVGTHDLWAATSVAHAISGTHDSGVAYPILQWSLDQEYSLLSDAPQLVEWSLDSEYSLVFPIPEWSLDSEWELRTLQEIQWTLDSQWVLGESTFTLDMQHAVSGHGVLDEFSTLLNSLRAGLDLPTIAISTRIVPDISQAQSRQMKLFGLLEHESALYPEGWRTIEERIEQVGAGYSGGENLAAITVEAGTSDTVTAAELFDAWVNSPPHYALMTYDFGTDADLEFLLGLEYFVDTFMLGETQYTAGAGFSYVLATLNIINFTIAEGEKVPVEFLLNSQYSLDTPMRESMDMQWATYAYSPVRARHHSTYALVLSAAHAAPFGTYISKAHTALLGYTVQATHTVLYAPTSYVVGQHTNMYDVQPYAFVQAAHNTTWAMELSVTHTAEYGSSPFVRVGFNTEYGDTPIVAAQHTNSYGVPQRVLNALRTLYASSEAVVAQFTTRYAIEHVVATAHTAAYGDKVDVVAQLAIPYDLLQYNPLSVTHRTHYSISSGDVVPITGTLLVKIAGIEIDCNSVQLDMDDGDTSWTGTISINDTSRFAAIQRGDSVEIDFYGEVFHLVVDSKTIDRSSLVDIDMSVKALSPLSLLDAPETPTIDRVQVVPVSAHTLVEDLLGQTVAWHIVDWVIPPYRFAVEGVTPLSAAKLVAKAAGAVILSEPDGSVAVQYDYPVAVPEYYTAIPDFVMTDSDHNLTYAGKVQNMETFNMVRVRDDDGTNSDYFEWEPDGDVPDRGVLRAYLLPWRPAVIEARHTGAQSVVLTNLGVESRNETTIVEIVNGIGRLQWPAVNIVAVTWLSDSLGSVYLEPRTREIRVPDTVTNWGYGLVEVTYTVECLKYEVQSPTGSSVQFILIDKGI